MKHPGNVAGRDTDHTLALGKPERRGSGRVDGTRRVEIIADLARVRVLCEGKVVADYDRLWARHQTVSDPAHVAAAKTLRQHRIAILRSAPEPEVQLRCLADYDTALGLDDARAGWPDACHQGHQP